MMNKLLMLVIVFSITLWSAATFGQPLQADQPTEAVGMLCRTMEKHPPPTSEANYNVLDYAICGPGGLRVYPQPQIADQFNKYKFGTQGEKPGKGIVYLYGFMRTLVMPAFDGRQRFRFSYLAADQMKTGISFFDGPKFERKGDVMSVSVKLKNPFGKPIQGTEVVLTLKGSEYLRPFTKMVPMLNPGETREVKFDILSSGKKPKGRMVIKNYGRLYIDIAKDF